MVGKPDIVTKYQDDILKTFSSPLFMNGSAKEKKEAVGTCIYQYVAQLVGNEMAPKITGMLIDLPVAEMNQCAQNYHVLYSKVSAAFQLLQNSKQPKQ